jgi:hypothetical protein
MVGNAQSVVEPRKEARPAIVAALHDVQGYSIQMDTGRQGMTLS